MGKDLGPLLQKVGKTQFTEEMASELLSTGFLAVVYREGRCFSISRDEFYLPPVSDPHGDAHSNDTSKKEEPDSTNTTSEKP